MNCVSSVIAAEENLRALFEVIDESVCLIGGNGIVLSANKVFAARLGIGVADCLGKSIYSLIPAELVASRQSFIEAVLRNGRPVIFEDQRQGCWLHHRLCPVLGADGKVDRIAIYALDVTGRKHVEERLAESNQLLAGVLDHTHMMTAFLDPRFNFIWVNRAYAHACKHPISFFPGKNHFNLYPHAGNQAIFQRVVDTGEPFSVTGKPFEFPDQPERGVSYWDWSLIPVKDGSGMVTGLVFTLVDVTEQTRMQDAMRQVNARLALAQRAAGAGVWDWDLTTEVLSWTPELFCLFGLDPSTAVASFETWRGVVHPEDRAAAEERISTAVRDHVRLASEYRIVLPSGEIRWINAFGDTLYDADGRPMHMMGICIDNTLGKRSAEALQESERRFRSAFDYSAIGMALVSTEGRWIKVNHATCEMLGYSESDLLTKTFQDITHPDDLDADLACVRQMLAGDVATYQMEKRYFHKSGSVVWVLLSVSLVRDTHGVPIYFISQIQNITANKRAEQERVALQSQFQHAQRLESVGRLAGGVAHDFNNLLQGMMSCVELCRDGVEPEHPIRRYLDEITRDANRSANLVRQLLAFARKQTIAPKVMDLNATVTATLKMLRRLLGEAVDLVWLPGSDAGAVLMDPSQLDQILANLTVNAKDALKGAGKLVIESQAAVLDAVFCAEHQGSVPGRYSLLIVSDTGCGMAKETLAHLFEPFFTTKKVGEGTGLGLSTVYGIVKQNGGYIDVQSEPGAGTAFRIYLPCVGESVSPTVVASSPARIMGGPETILVVEDEDSIRFTVRRILEKLGYTVLVAEFPEQALQLVAGHVGEIHLLLTDVVMPGMSGSDLALRMAALRPAVKRLFMSGYNAEMISHQGTIDESLDFLAKPFSREDLARKVREVLDRGEGA